MNEQSQILYKILVVNVSPNSNYSSSSLVIKATEDLFSDSFVSTIGVDFKTLNFEHNKEKIKLQIWDTAGQERFRTITQSYQRSANGVVLLCDLSGENILDALKGQLDYFSENCPHISSILIVGNTDPQKINIISDEILNSFSIEKGCSYISICIENNHNCKLAFETLGIQIYEDKKFTLQTAIAQIKSSECQNTISMKFKNLNNSDAEKLAETIKSGKFPNGLSLDLRKNSIGNAGANILAEAVTESKKYIKINLEGNDNIDQNIIIDISTRAQVNRFINTNIHLCFNFIFVMNNYNFHYENIIPKDIQHLICFFLLQNINHIVYENTDHFSIREKAYAELGFFKDVNTKCAAIEKKLNRDNFSMEKEFNTLTNEVLRLTEANPILTLQLIEKVYNAIIKQEKQYSDCGYFGGSNIKDAQIKFLEGKFLAVLKYALNNSDDKFTISNIVNKSKLMEHNNYIGRNDAEILLEDHLNHNPIIISPGKMNKK